MKQCYAYTRVSTVRQGEKGTSLNEQRDAITLFASRHDIDIVEWYEERETAAKQGRGEFSRLMRTLKRQRQRGVIFHKIDRGARNLKDWSNIQDLIELGVDVFFAHESLDMTSRGGRLTADLLAVIASDYIRNLRDEVKKGIRGRLKQGLFPLPAPLGYLDQGGGKAKILDPVRSPLVRQAFELYGTGSFTLDMLAEEMKRRGLRNKVGKPLRANRLGDLLKRPFYIGLLQMRDDTYTGIHQPLVSKQLFDRVQDTLAGKAQKRAIRHEFTYRRMIRCMHCGYKLIGEVQKGNIYYRCHTKTCPTTSIRESQVEAMIRKTLARVSLTEREAAQVEELARVNQLDATRALEAAEQNRELLLKQNEDRLSRLTDAFLDGAVDQALFQEKRRALLHEQVGLRGEVDQDQSMDHHARLMKFLELVTNLQQSYISANPADRREIVKTTTSNLAVSGKKLDIELHYLYAGIAKCRSIRFSGPKRCRPRTFMKYFYNAVDHDENFKI